jgi:heat-inducible transcriptional repressor
MEELSERQKQILRFIVGEYVRTATPVSSETVARRLGLGVSPATVRNEMSVLEVRGYVSHPHTSAGRVPTDLGYRYFVQYLLGKSELDASERKGIQDELQRVELSQDQWLPMAATLLARSVQSASVVTPPQAARARLKHFELISVQDHLALLVMVLQEGTIKQQFITFAEPVGQEELSRVANRLNARYAGHGKSQIRKLMVDAFPLERNVSEVIVNILRQRDEEGEAEIYHDGLVHILAQPEFSQTERARRLLELMEQRGTLAPILRQALASPDVQVIIGAENPSEQMRDYGMVLARYGVEGQAAGVLGVLGPTRLPYGRAIGTVRFMSVLLSKLLAELYD